MHATQKPRSESCTVSVVIPARNSEKTLPACIQSLQCQTEATPLEIIVVDDGSQDGTGQVASSMGAFVIRQAPAGPAVARNCGVRAASGDIVLFTDADCVPAPDWVQAMTDPFENPEVKGVKGSYKTRQTGIVPLLAQVEFEERYDLLEKHAFIDMVDTYAAGFRRDVFLSWGGFDESFETANNEDTEFSYRLALAGMKLVFVRKAWVYHTHPARWVDYARKKFGRGVWRMMAYAMHPGKAVRDSYTPQSLKLQVVLLPTMVAGLILGGGIGGALGLLLGFGGLAAFTLAGANMLSMAFRKGIKVGALCFVFLSVRAGAIGAGSVFGLLRLVLFRRRVKGGRHGSGRR